MVDPTSAAISKGLIGVTNTAGVTLVALNGHKIESATLDNAPRGLTVSLDNVLVNPQGLGIHHLTITFDSGSCFLTEVLLPWHSVKSTPDGIMFASDPASSYPSQLMVRSNGESLALSAIIGRASSYHAVVTTTITGQSATQYAMSFEDGTQNTVLATTTPPLVSSLTCGLLPPSVGLNAKTSSILSTQSASFIASISHVSVDCGADGQSPTLSAVLRIGLTKVQSNSLSFRVTAGGSGALLSIVPSSTDGMPLANPKFIFSKAAFADINSVSYQNFPDGGDAIALNATITVSLFQNNLQADTSIVLDKNGVEEPQGISLTLDGITAKIHGLDCSGGASCSGTNVTISPPTTLTEQFGSIPAFYTNGSLSIDRTVPLSLSIGSFVASGQGWGLDYTDKKLSISADSLTLSQMSPQSQAILQPITITGLKIGQSGVSFKVPPAQLDFGTFLTTNVSGSYDSNKALLILNIEKANLNYEDHPEKESGTVVHLSYRNILGNVPSIRIKLGDPVPVFDFRGITFISSDNSNKIIGREFSAAPCAQDTIAASSATAIGNLFSYLNETSSPLMLCLATHIAPAEFRTGNDLVDATLLFDTAARKLVAAELSTPKDQGVQIRFAGRFIQLSNVDVVFDPTGFTDQADDDVKSWLGTTCVPYMRGSVNVEVGSALGANTAVASANDNHGMLAVMGFGKDCVFAYADGLTAFQVAPNVVATVENVRMGYAPSATPSPSATSAPIDVKRLATADATVLPAANGASAPTPIPDVVPKMMISHFTVAGTISSNGFGVRFSELGYHHDDSIPHAKPLRAKVDYSGSLQASAPGIVGSIVDAVKYLAAFVFGRYIK